MHLIVPIALLMIVEVERVYFFCHVGLLYEKENDRIFLKMFLSTTEVICLCIDVTVHIIVISDKCEYMHITEGGCILFSHNGI